MSEVLASLVDLVVDLLHCRLLALHNLVSKLCLDFERRVTDLVPELRESADHFLLECIVAIDVGLFYLVESLPDLCAEILNVFEHLLVQEIIKFTELVVQRALDQR